MRYKCNTCHLIFSKEDVIIKDGKDTCPDCGETFLEKMCEADHICTCAHEVTYGARYCEKCGAAICPCGSHDILVLSRVTVYLQDLSGFNAAKKQEVKDRHHYDIG